MAQLSTRRYSMLFTVWKRFCIIHDVMAPMYLFVRLLRNDSERALVRCI